jgi:hypothetical protein
MPHYNGVSAHIYTSTPLAEYPAPSDTASLFPVVSVYVEAQPGNYFSITCDALPSNVPNTIAFQSKIDGKNYHEGCSFRAGQKDSGVWIDNNAFQRYRFQDVKLVEERVLGMISREQAAGIGVIEVAVRRCTQKIIVKEIGEKEERKEKRDELKLKKSSMGGSPKKELAVFETLHEKDAKGRDVGAMVRFVFTSYTPACYLLINPAVLDRQCTRPAAAGNPATARPLPAPPSNWSIGRTAGNSRMCCFAFFI